MFFGQKPCKIPTKKTISPKQFGVKNNSKSFEKKTLPLFDHFFPSGGDKKKSFLLDSINFLQKYFKNFGQKFQILYTGHFTTEIST